ncbi:hypothetical protein V6N13_134567 [Hibiscus sabdariffa]
MPSARGKANDSTANISKEQSAKKFIEYIMLDGMNGEEQHAHQLSKLLEAFQVERADMADALVSALVSTILNNLDSLFREEVGLAGSLKTELESLQRTFTTIQAVLHDAEQKQWKSEAIKIWLRNLQQAAYDLEDVLDDFQSQAQERGSKVTTFFSLQNPLLFRSSMARRVKAAREKVDAIAAERIKFHLETGVGEAVIEGNKDRETSSLVDESEVIGRADEKGEMISMILSNRDDLSIYAICGMGGLGKSCDIQDLDPLQRHLVKQLVGKRFLIVLDDVWNESRDKWDRLKQALQSGGRGSAVIVTTRLEKVALMMVTVPFRRLGCLSDDDSWSLFKQTVFGMGTNEGNADLEPIGRQIVQRCGGIPLAIKAMGSILSSKSQESEWLHVRDSEIWDLEDEVNRILAVLSSSSTNIINLSKLPPLRSLILDSNSRFTFNISNPSNFISNQKHLKVLDCGGRLSNAVFKSLKHLRYLRFHDSYVKALPESISSLHNLQTLNLQWCRNLQKLPKGLKNLKNLKYLDLRDCNELISMPVGLGQLTCLRKLSKFVVGKDKGGGIDELKELALEGELSITGLCNVKNSTEAKNANLIEKKNLRSLELYWRSGKYSESCCHHEHGNDEEVLDALQPHPSLKKLCITDYQGVRFPNWMIDLLLPNLVEIELHCKRCDQLPPLGKLGFLKVLSIWEMGALKCMDSGFYGDMESSFPSLEVLTIVRASCLEEWTTTNGTKHFPRLSSLTIAHCPKMVKLPMLRSLKELEVFGANVTVLNSLTMNATNLTSLRLHEYNEPMSIPDGLLRSHKHLETLWINGFSLKSSSVLLDNLYSLKCLILHRCSQLESLPRGLQNLSCLETLRLYGCESLVSLAVNGLQDLSSLSSLEIQSCGKLTSLPESIQHLSSLWYLSIANCERLSCLPNEIQHLTSLSKLDIVDCPNMMSLPQGIRSLTALQTLTIEGCPHLERRWTQQKCIACYKTVCLFDKLTADNRVFHKACFRCHHCRTTLKLSNYLDKSFEGTPKMARPEKHRG